MYRRPRLRCSPAFPYIEEDPRSNVPLSCYAIGDGTVHRRRRRGPLGEYAGGNRTLRGEGTAEGGRPGPPPSACAKGGGRPNPPEVPPYLPAPSSGEEGRRGKGVRCGPPPGKNPEGGTLRLSGEGEGEALRREAPSASPPAFAGEGRFRVGRRGTHRGLPPRRCRRGDGRGEEKPRGAVGSPTPWSHPRMGASTALRPSTRTPPPRRRPRAHGGRRGGKGAGHRGPQGEQLRWRVLLGGPPDRGVNHDPDGFVATRRPSAALFDGPSRKPKGGGAPRPPVGRSGASRCFGGGMAASKPTPQSVMRWRTGSSNEPGESLGDLGRWSGLFPLRLRTFAPGVSRLRAAFGDA